jgi:hypothetical protein
MRTPGTPRSLPPNKEAMAALSLSSSTQHHPPQRRNNCFQPSKCVWLDLRKCVSVKHRKISKRGFVWFCTSRIWTQVPALARQAFYHMSCSISPFCCGLGQPGPWSSHLCLPYSRSNRCAPLYPATDWDGASRTFAQAGLKSKSSQSQPPK